MELGLLPGLPEKLICLIPWDCQSFDEKHNCGLGRARQTGRRVRCFVVTTNGIFSQFQSIRARQLDSRDCGSPLCRIGGEEGILETVVNT